MLCAAHTLSPTPAISLHIALSLSRCQIRLLSSSCFCFCFSSSCFLLYSTTAAWASLKVSLKSLEAKTSQSVSEMILDASALQSQGARSPRENARRRARWRGGERCGGKAGGVRIGELLVRRARRVAALRSARLCAGGEVEKEGPRRCNAIGLPVLIRQGALFRDFQ